MCIESARGGPGNKDHLIERILDREEFGEPESAETAKNEEETLINAVHSPEEANAESKLHVMNLGPLRPGCICRDV